MEEKHAIIHALRSLLRPVVKLLLQLGFSFRDFNEVAKTIFVEVASEEYGIRGRKTNISRVAIMTGLTRREASRLRHVVDREPTISLDPSNTVGKILSAWHQDAKYLDSTGKPRVLPTTGNHSFQTLIEEYGGDIPATALTKELERVGSIKVDHNQVTALKRYYMPFVLEAQAIERFGSVLNDVGQTITHNLLSDRRDDARFEGRALNENMPSESLAAFREYVDSQGQHFLENIDDWLTAHERVYKEQSSSSKNRKNDGTIRLGIGVYLVSSDQ